MYLMWYTGCLCLKPKSPNDAKVQLDISQKEGKRTPAIFYSTEGAASRCGTG